MKTYRPSSPSRHRDRQALERRRLKAAKLFKKGIPQAEVAFRLNVTPAAVSQWHTMWITGREAKLRSRGRTGPKSNLTDTSLRRIQDTLLRGPSAFGYTTDIWTLGRIQAVMKKVSGLNYGMTHVWRILTIQLGWSSQKPETRARERNEAAIRHWKRWVWPQVKRGRKN